MRAGLERLMNAKEGHPANKLQRLFRNAPYLPEGAIPWAEADLDGDGSQEYVLALPVTDYGTYDRGHGAALFVIYRRDGRYQVDVTGRMSEQLEFHLVAPQLYGVADLAGLGRPQVLWDLWRSQPARSRCISSSRPGSRAPLPPCPGPW